MSRRGVMRNHESRISQEIFPGISSYTNSWIIPEYPLCYRLLSSGEKSLAVEDFVSHVEQALDSDKSIINFVKSAVKILRPDVDID